VTVKAAMTLDGKIATASGESKWITGEKARQYAMRLRQGANAILVGINTILADDPALTVRPVQSPKLAPLKRPVGGGSKVQGHSPRRIVLDAHARTPLTAKVVADEFAGLTTLVVSEAAPKKRVAALAGKVNVLVAPLAAGVKVQSSMFNVQDSKLSPPSLDLPWLLARLGSENVTSLLVEGGGEVNASFLMNGLAHRVAFFYAPKILGGRDSRKAVAGDGARTLDETLNLADLKWRRLGPDWLLTARVTANL